MKKHLFSPTLWLVELEMLVLVCVTSDFLKKLSVSTFFKLFTILSFDEISPIMSGFAVLALWPSTCPGMKVYLVLELFFLPGVELSPKKLCFSEDVSMLGFNNPRQGGNYQEKVPSPLLPLWLYSTWKGSAYGFGMRWGKGMAR